ncbi:MAG: DUF3649 domain-containing protein [Desulfovibrionales bacterium]
MDQIVCLASWHSVWIPAPVFANASPWHAWAGMTVRGSFTFQLRKGKKFFIRASRRSRFSLAFPSACHGVVLRRRVRSREASERV